MDWLTEKVNELYGNELLETAKVHVQVYRSLVRSLLVEEVSDEKVDEEVREAMDEYPGEDNCRVSIAVEWCEPDLVEFRKKATGHLASELAGSLESQVMESINTGALNELGKIIFNRAASIIDWVALAELYLTDAGIEGMAKEMIREMVEEKIEEIEGGE